MENKDLIRRLVKLQLLCVRYVERHTTLKCDSKGGMNRLLMKNKLTITYGEAVQNLYDNIEKYCSNSKYLIDAAFKLKQDINNSTIKTLRFGYEPQRKFTEEESVLDTEVIRRQLFMLNAMVEIKDITQILNNKVTESAVKQACQQERLLNTKKVGRTWLVHIPECRAYWNVPDTCDSHLYKDYVY